MCKVLCWVQVLQKQIKFSLQGACWLEGETYELKFQYQMEPLIQYMIEHNLLSQIACV